MLTWQIHDTFIDLLFPTLRLCVYVAFKTLVPHRVKKKYLVLRNLESQIIPHS